LAIITCNTHFVQWLKHQSLYSDRGLVFESYAAISHHTLLPFTQLWAPGGVVN